MTTTKNTTTTTSAYDVGSTSAFCIKQGVPLGVAFDELSAMIDASRSALAALAETDTEGAGALWAVCKSLEMSHALVQAMHIGHREASHADSA